MGAHHAGDGAFVGQRQGAVAQFVRALHQFLWMRGAALKAEVAQRVQLCVGGQHHPYTPCKNQPPVARSRKIQTVPAAGLWATK